MRKGCTLQPRATATPLPNSTHSCPCPPPLRQSFSNPLLTHCICPCTCSPQGRGLPLSTPSLLYSTQLQSPSQAKHSTPSKTPRPLRISVRLPDIHTYISWFSPAPLHSVPAPLQCWQCPGPSPGGQWAHTPTPHHRSLPPVIAGSPLLPAPHPPQLGPAPAPAPGCEASAARLLPLLQGQRAQIGRRPLSPAASSLGAPPAPQVTPPQRCRAAALHRLQWAVLRLLAAAWPEALLH